MNIETIVVFGYDAAQAYKEFAVEYVAGEEAGVYVVTISKEAVDTLNNTSAAPEYFGLDFYYGLGLGEYKINGQLESVYLN